MGNVGKRSAVDNGGRLFRGLNQIGTDGIFEEHDNRTGHAEVVDGEGTVVKGVTQQNLPDSPPQVFFIGCETENCHQFRSGCDVETGLLRNAVDGGTESCHNAAQGAVVHVKHASPQDFFQSEAFCPMLIEIVVKQGGNHVVGRGDGVEVTGEVEVDAFHGEHLSVASSGSPSFHAETRSERGFTQCDAGFFANGVQSEGKSDAHGGFPDAGFGGGDGGDENQFASFLLLKERERKFCHGLPVGFDLVGINAEALCHFADGFEGHAAGDFNVCLHA